LKETAGAVDAVGLWDLDGLEALRWALFRGEASCSWACMSPTMRNVDVHGEFLLTHIEAKESKWAWLGFTCASTFTRDVNRSGANHG
jgi:hypothetical protein